ELRRRIASKEAGIERGRHIARIHGGPGRKKLRDRVRVEGQGDIVGIVDHVSVDRPAEHNGEIGARGQPRPPGPYTARDITGDERSGEREGGTDASAPPGAPPARPPPPASPRR